MLFQKRIYWSNWHDVNALPGVRPPLGFIKCRPLLTNCCFNVSLTVWCNKLALLKDYYWVWQRMADRSGAAVWQVILFKCLRLISLLCKCIHNLWFLVENLLPLRTWWEFIQDMLLVMRKMFTIMSDFDKQIYQWHNLTKLINKPQLVRLHREYSDSLIRGGFNILMKCSHDCIKCRRHESKVSICKANFIVKQEYLHMK